MSMNGADPGIRLKRRAQQRPSKKQAEKQVADWNAKYPVGVLCRVYRLSNPREDLKGLFQTTTPAQLLGEMPVVWLAGVSGCWGLDALEVEEVKP